MSKINAHLSYWEWSITICDMFVHVVKVFIIWEVSRTRNELLLGSAECNAQIVQIGWHIFIWSEQCRNSGRYILNYLIQLEIWQSRKLSYQTFIRRTLCRKWKSDKKVHDSVIFPIFCRIYQQPFYPFHTLLFIS